MERDFLRSRLSDTYGIAVSTPDEPQRLEIHRIIYEELCLGQIKDSSRDYFLDVIRRLTEMDIDGVVLGCTEISLLIQQAHVQIPVLDTASIHAELLVDFAIDTYFLALRNTKVV